MLIDKNHYFKQFKKPVEDHIQYDIHLKTNRKNLFSSIHLPFLFLNQTTELNIDEDFIFILLDNADLSIEGDFKTLVIEDISTNNNKIHIKTLSDSKVIFINNPQTSLSVEKEIIFDNSHHLQLYLTAVRKNTFVKNNLLLNLFEHSNIDTQVFINTSDKQLFDLTTEIIHKQSDTVSQISFMGLNEGKLVSQINSVIEIDSKNCEIKQQIKHILFNNSAMSYSKPSLMISTPCVASHGNSIGSIPEDWLFYLQTRGISSEQCLHIINQSLTTTFLESLELPFIQQLLEYS